MANNVSTFFQSSSNTINVTDWVAYTPTISGFGSCTTVSFFWRRCGDSMEVQGFFTSGTVAASLGTFTLPNSLIIDTAKMTVANTTANAGQIVGNAMADSTNQWLSLVTATGTSTALVYITTYPGTASGLVPNFPNQTFSNTTKISIRFVIPISGWTSLG